MEMMPIFPGGQLSLNAVRHELKSCFSSLDSAFNGLARNPSKNELYQELLNETKEGLIQITMALIKECEKNHNDKEDL